MNGTARTAGTGAFAALHRRGRPFVLPNAWDVASALLVRLPLNLLWRPEVDMAQLAVADVARVSTGSAPYRRALAAGLATAIAARDGVEAPRSDLPYGALLDLLKPDPEEIRAASEAGAQSTPVSRA
jgi:2-methylisocitrate lyase-like PEP mutase family enzyme